MISAAMIQAPEQRQLDYILGVRERNDKLMRDRSRRSSLIHAC